MPPTLNRHLQEGFVNKEKKNEFPTLHVTVSHEKKFQRLKSGVEEKREEANGVLRILAAQFKEAHLQLHTLTSLRI